MSTLPPSAIRIQSKELIHRINILDKNGAHIATWICAIPCYSMIINTNDLPTSSDYIVQIVGAEDAIIKSSPLNQGSLN